MSDIKHGLTAFQKGCRCSICKETAVASAQKYKAVAAKRFQENPESLKKHGIYGYQIGCRCELCVKAFRDCERKNHVNNVQHFKKTGDFRGKNTRHGTLTAYGCGCRCDLCKQAKSDQHLRLSGVQHD